MPKIKLPRIITTSAPIISYHLFKKASPDHHRITVLSPESSPRFFTPLSSLSPTQSCRTSVRQKQGFLSVLFIAVEFSVNKIYFPRSFLPPPSSSLAAFSYKFLYLKRKSAKELSGRAMAVKGRQSVAGGVTRVPATVGAPGQPVEPLVSNPSRWGEKRSERLELPSRPGGSQRCRSPEAPGALPDRREAPGSRQQGPRLQQTRRRSA